MIALLYGKKFGRVLELLRLIIQWTAIVCLICTVLFEAFPLFFIRMFGADGELYTQFAVQCLRIYLSLILFTCVQKVCAVTSRLEPDMSAHKIYAQKYALYCKTIDCLDSLWPEMQSFIEVAD